MIMVCTISYTKKFFVLNFALLKQNTIFATAKSETSIVTIYCGMEQLVARWAHNPKVVGSSPAPATQSIKKPL